jgi:hypothetical protein
MAETLGTQRLNLARARARRAALVEYVRERVTKGGAKYPMGTLEERGFFAGYNAGFADGLDKGLDS